ncbi:neuroligin-1-like [Agrilus planipennis]|uniref:Neuroligin-1-like n=1 Tax=Agrilus planipennis TaxID=224129 RepID=A0A7F5RNL4_AGRPL|nr:neuroligin-1-like [Agrilus planipennis]XP_025837618.1 neuroligin-1-like [Agrilus planipennis]XP_025837619.1 neuroligin-1-like [Agrilus planipennis]
MRVPLDIAGHVFKFVSQIFRALWLLIVVVCLWNDFAVSVSVHKYSTRVVNTKYGPLRGVIVHSHPPVEAFLGVPYATPPVGSLRYMPPVTPSLWKNTRLADRFSTVCPQKPPDIGNRTEALLEFPRGRLLFLEKLLPLLANQSEDCLYLNVYVPRQVSGEEETEKLPCIVYVHGESYEWNSGNPYDGTVLASSGKVIVVTINFRLGVLGFVKTGAKGSTQGNFGLMDLVAGLHWLRENLPAFGGDPERVTLMGHGTGAALVNFIAVSPVAKELLHRAILLSGSGLSPWAMQKDPLAVKRHVAEQTGCHGDLVDDDLAPCLRMKSLEQLLEVQVKPPRFLPGFAPFVDGTILVTPTAPPPPSSSTTIATSSGYELADFPERDLLFSLTTTESYLDLSAQDLEFGFNETRRDRILRTYVRNSYYFHLNEIFSTLKNEYTDWEKPTQNPLSVRDATLEVLSDGHTVAPLIRVGYLHSLRGGKTFFLHFQLQSAERDFPQKVSSVRGEDIPYVLGLPLVGGGAYFPSNYSQVDTYVSRLLIGYISNFARVGDPNGVRKNEKKTGNDHLNLKSAESEETTPFWDTYDTINQLYLELGRRPEIRSHYRGHKMSLWLNLIPQLHRPGVGDDTSMRHHHFQEEGDQYYDGFVRPQSMQKPSIFNTILFPPSTKATTTTTPLPPKSDTALQAMTTECPPNTTLSTPVTKISSNNLLKKLASSHYQSYTTALTVTITVGCFLLLLNILIFAGIYHQRDRSKKKEKKKQEELMETGNCSSSSEECFDAKSQIYELQKAHYDSCKRSDDLSKSNAINKSYQFGFISADIRHEKKTPDVAEVRLQDLKSSPGAGKKFDTNSSEMQRHSTSNSPNIPEPPPPPKNQPPVTNECSSNQAGILRAHGVPITPSSTKKRVQIQEISV